MFLPYSNFLHCCMSTNDIRGLSKWLFMWLLIKIGKLKMTALINCYFSQLLDYKRAINKCRIKNSTHAHSTDMLNKRIPGSAMVHCNTIKVWMTGTEKKRACSRGILRISTMGGPHSQTRSIVERCSSHQPAATSHSSHITTRVSSKPLCTASEASHTEAGFHFIFFFGRGLTHEAA